MNDDRDARMIRVEDLPTGENAETFNGHEHRASVSMFLSHNRPGTGPDLHRHPYEEIFIIQEGRCTFHVDGTEFDAEAGEIVIAPAGAAHRFVNTGDGPLKQIDIHLSPSFSTEWLTG